MIIRIPLLFEGDKSEKHLYALFESGAGYSFITPEAAASLSTILKLPNPMRMITAKDDAYLYIHQTTVLDFSFEDVKMRDEFLVTPHLTEDVIIGAYTMQKWHMNLDFKRNTVLLHPSTKENLLRTVKRF